MMKLELGIDVRDVVSIEVSVGKPTEIVRDYEKLFSFFGTGMGPADIVKFVSAGISTDSGCDTYNENITSLGLNGKTVESGGYLGRISQIDGKLEDRSMRSILFYVESNLYPFKLCYKFGNEPFKLFQQHTIFTKLLVSMESDTGSPNVAVADATIPKLWSFLGYGVEEGDFLKWVPYGTTSDADCGTGGNNGQPMTGKSIVDNELFIRTYSNVGLVQSIPEPMNFNAASPEGEPYKLCYKFAAEPYKLYAGLVLRSMRVTSVTVNIGSPELITAGLIKTFFFSGTGVQDNDRFKFVPSHVSSDSQCGSGCENAHGMEGPDSINNCEGSVKESGSRVGFTVASDEDKALRLCYRFGTDNYKLYKDFTLFVAAVSEILVEHGDSAVAVVNVRKRFVFKGTGVAKSVVKDKAKFVSQADVQKSEDCAAAPSPLVPGHDDLQVSSGKYIEPVYSKESPRHFPLLLCYKFGTEGYVLMKQFKLVVKHILQVSNTKAIVKSQQQVTFYGNHVSDYVLGLGGAGAGIADMAKWIPVGGDCETSAAILGSTLESVTRKLCVSEYECSLTPYGTSTYVFEHYADNSSGTAELCYRFATEPFTHYPNFTITIINPNITSLSSNTVVVNALKTLQLEGTFGITVNDAIKWVLYSSKTCDAPNIAGSDKNIIVVSSVSSDVDGMYVRKQSDILLDAYPPNRQALKLCYRFGTGPFIMFPQYAIYAKQLLGITLLSSGEVDLVIGAKAIFLFDGIGISDGDRVRWVKAAASTDEDCLTMITSEEGIVEEGQASFSFANNVDGAKVCYKFGVDNYKLYKDVPIVKQGEQVVEAYVNKRAEVTLKLNGDLDEIPYGSPARAEFIINFKNDVSLAIGIPLSRLNVIDIKRGSIIVAFTIDPVPVGETGMLAQQAASLLEAQVNDADSLLLNGNVTSRIDTTVFPNPAIKVLPLTDEEIKNATDAAAGKIPTVTAVASSISVTAYQKGGLFVFSQGEYVVAENEKKATIVINRRHGSVGRVPVQYSTSDGTATEGSDYTKAFGTIVFNDGEVEKTFTISVVNDHVAESHKETVILTLHVVGGIEGTKAGRLNSATLSIYDFLDGKVLVSDNFGLESGSTNDTMGWSVVGNGANPAWIDTNGLYSVDQLFAGEEYDPACDYAATSPCGHSCTHGGGFAEAGDGEGYGSGVLELNENGIVASTASVAVFPTNAMTVSMWVRSTDVALPEISNKKSIIFSYEVPAVRGEAPYGSHEFYIDVGSSKASDVQIMIRGKDSSKRIMSESTGINVNDGEWHFIAIAWRSAGGEIVAFKDGTKAFTGGPYRADLLLSSQGSVVLGKLQAINTPCIASTNDPFDAQCAFVPETQYKGQLQNVRVWNTFRSQRQVHLGMQWPFTALRLGLVMYWRFTNTSTYDVVDLGGDGHVFEGKRRRFNTTSIVDGSPSIHPNYPCGNVHHNVWHFKAPKRFLQQLPFGYDGRLQFSLFAASFTGTARSLRGSVEIIGANGNRLSYNLAGFKAPTSSNWKGYSVVLREDFGWVVEPLGIPATFQDLNGVLENASQLLIRGDAWQYSRTGYGQEAVYLNNVTLIERNGQ